MEVKITNLLHSSFGESLALCVLCVCGCAVQVCVSVYVSVFVCVGWVSLSPIRQQPSQIRALHNIQDEYQCRFTSS